MTEEKKNLVWLDLETTGLEPEGGEILEAGIVLTDLELNEINRMSWVLPHRREDLLPLMDDYVLNMHLGNGLLKEVWATRIAGDNLFDFQRKLEVKRKQVFTQIANWIITQTTADRKHCFLAGSSVGGFDKLWLTKHAPEILKAVHYRVGDVSSFNVFFPGLLKTEVRSPAHRALDDLDFSISKLRQMRTLLQGAGLLATEPQELDV